MFRICYWDIAWGLSSLRNYLSRYGSGIDGAIVMGTGMQPKAVLNAAKAVTKLQKAFLGDTHVSRLLDKWHLEAIKKRLQTALEAWIGCPGTKRGSKIPGRSAVRLCLYSQRV